MYHVLRSNDPLYGVSPYETSVLGTAHAVNIFQKITETFEFNRLNFLRQEGLSSFAFPSATHSRFSTAIGGWFLAEYATKNVLVRVQNETIWLSDKLKNLNWLNEFCLTLLLHDIGYYPFTHAINNNDIFRNKYKETQGIELRHRDFFISMLRGQGQLYNILSEYIDKHTGNKELYKNAFISERLRCMEEVDAEKIAYLLNPADSKSKEVNEDDQRFLCMLRHLAIGAIGLRLLNRYNRLAHFLLGRESELPISELLQNLTLDNEHLVLTGSGVDHVFQVLYTVKNSLFKKVFENEKRIAFEVMLNYAINQHWDKCKDTDFVRYFPFMDEDAVLCQLRRSCFSEVRETINRIFLRKPFVCVGHFRLKDDAYEQICTVDNRGVLHASETLLGQRRRKGLDSIDEALGYLKEDCFVRLATTFGRSDMEAVAMADDPLWMDLDQFFIEQQGGGYEALSRLDRYKDIVAFFNGLDKQHERSFWLFIKDRDAPLSRQLKEKAGKLGAELITA